MKYLTYLFVGLLTIQSFDLANFSAEKGSRSCEVEFELGLSQFCCLIWH